MIMAAQTVSAGGAASGTAQTAVPVQLPSPRRDGQLRQNSTGTVPSLLSTAQIFI